MRDCRSQRRRGMRLPEVGLSGPYGHRAVGIDLQSADDTRLQTRHVDSNGSQSVRGTACAARSNSRRDARRSFWLVAGRGPASAGPAGDQRLSGRCACAWNQLGAFPALESKRAAVAEALQPGGSIERFEQRTVSRHASSKSAATICMLTSSLSVHTIVHARPPPAGGPKVRRDPGAIVATQGWVGTGP